MNLIYNESVRGKKKQITNNEGQRKTEKLENVKMEKIELYYIILYLILIMIIQNSKNII